MVVVAVRDAGAGGRAARLGLRVLVAAGLSFVAWALGTLLSGSTASADETQSAALPPRHSPSEPRLLAGLSTALTGLVNTVDQAATQITQVTQAVVEPVQTTVGLPAQAPVQTLLPSVIRIGTLDQGKSEPRRAEALVPTPLPAPAQPLVVPAPARAVSTYAAHPNHLRPVTPVPFTQGVDRPDGGVHARHTDPPPLPPMRNGDPSIAVATSHDGGGAGKHPFVVLGSRLAQADLRPVGVAVIRPVSHEGRNAALPTTSPD